MSQILTLELDDEVFAAIQRHAEAVGTTPAAWVADSLERKYGRSSHISRQKADEQRGRERFENHFGEVDLGRATGADNESIDADLAKEYASSHEES